MNNLLKSNCYSIACITTQKYWYLKEQMQTTYISQVDINFSCTASPMKPMATSSNTKLYRAIVDISDDEYNSYNELFSQSSSEEGEEDALVDSSSEEGEEDEEDNLKDDKPSPPTSPPTSPPSLKLWDASRGESIRM